MRLFRLLLPTLFLTACAVPAPRPSVPDSVKAPPAVTAAPWPVVAIRFDAADGPPHHRLGVQIRPDLIATSLDVASFPERITGIYLIEKGQPVAGLLNAISGNGADLDLALMRVLALDTGVPLPRPARTIPLCAAPPAEGAEVTALGLDGAKYTLRLGPASPPGDHMRPITPIAAVPPSGAPVVAGDCLVGLYTPSRLVQSTGVDHLLRIL